MRVRLGGWVTALALAVAGIGLTTGPATAASGYCPGSGVNVVVDFGALGGGVAKACGQGSVARQAFTSAGFTLVDNPRVGNDFVCTIDGAPSNNQCAGTGDQGYWALFVANPGGGWVYASLGAGSQPVSNHQTVAFAWQTPGNMSGGGHRNPATSPAALTRPTAPKPTPTPTHHAVAPTPTKVTAKAKPSTSASPKPKKTAAVVPTATATASGATAAYSSTLAVSHHANKPGGGLPWWIPVGVVALLVAGAGGAWWRKRAGG